MLSQEELLRRRTIRLITAVEKAIKLKIQIAEDIEYMRKLQTQVGMNDIQLEQWIKTKRPKSYNIIVNALKS